MTEAHGAAAAPAHPPEIPNLITLVTHWMPEGPAKHFLHCCKRKLAWHM